MTYQFTDPHRLQTGQVHEAWQISPEAPPRSHRNHTDDHSHLPSIFTANGRDKAHIVEISSRPQDCQDKYRSINLQSVRRDPIKELSEQFGDMTTTEEPPMTGVVESPPSAVLQSIDPVQSFRHATTTFSRPSSTNNLHAPIVCDSSQGCRFELLNSSVHMSGSARMSRIPAHFDEMFPPQAGSTMRSRAHFMDDDYASRDDEAMGMDVDPDERRFED